ncbi:DUF2771 domain-containing protein [Streptomyces polyrhachis]|uniref:DUF2771 domain-containing protein n=1 Tax=Streptomyces polyrhachis TaxID=1282885 RepID=A0ABW2GGR0_9ACTN
MSTHPFRSLSLGTSRRVAAAAGVAAMSVALLAACEKPTPVAQLTVGDRTVTSEAACYGHGEPLAQAKLMKCLTKSDAESITLSPSEELRIGVDPDVADTGWYLLVNGNPYYPVKIKDTYFTLKGENVLYDQQAGGFADKVRIQIVETGAKGKQITGAEGVWNFVVKGKS